MPRDGRAELSKDMRGHDERISRKHALLQTVLKTSAFVPPTIRFMTLHFLGG